MLALLYLLDILLIGWFLLPRVLPWLLAVPQRLSLAGTPIPVQPWMIRWPAAWVLGALIVNWINFTLCDLMRSMHSGSLITLALATFAAVALAWHGRASLPTGAALKTGAAGLWRGQKAELGYLAFALVLATFIAWHTLSVRDGVLFVGNTVWSDFGPHLAVIRSFSLGDNFPPQYPHFPAGDIRYHFLFQFLVASFEHLGMRLDWAFNVPSILSLVSVFMLLYVLAAAITGSRAAGVLTGVLFIFRSSFAFFTFAKDHLDGDLWNAIVNVSLHIGKTQNESWGLWAQNVYANQRHFAFSICVFVMILLMLLPLLQASADNHGDEQQATSWRAWLVSLITPEGWLPQSWLRAITLGVLLGAIGFWNGAVVITALIVLAVMTVFSRQRLEYLVIAVLAVVLAQLQSKWFISGGSIVKPSFFFGFLAEHKTGAGVAAFLIELMGIFIPIFIISVIGAIRGLKGLAIAFITPLVFALTISLTTDINANHKFIMLSVMLANIAIAAFLVKLWQSRDAALRSLAAVFFALLTVTGYVDLLTLYNMNQGNVLIPMNDPVAGWIAHNTRPGDVFLTDWSVLHPAQFAGRPIYFGWPYYAWSAGYDTDTRGQWWKRMYSTTSRTELVTIALGEKIAYIVVDDAVRASHEYNVNEAMIATTFPLVFASEKDHTKIYRVQ